MYSVETCMDNSFIVYPNRYTLILLEQWQAVVLGEPWSTVIVTQQLFIYIKPSLSHPVENACYVTITVGRGSPSRISKKCGKLTIFHCLLLCQIKSLKSPFIKDLHNRSTRNQCQQSFSSKRKSGEHRRICRRLRIATASLLE